MITENVLGQILPALPQDKRQEYAPLLQSATTEFGITTPLRQAAFIAQLAHESQQFTRLVENLNYSAPRLRAVWPKRFPNDAIANAHARQPEKLANFVYANRNGNGPPESGDGFRYRGRGFIQLTGRANYRQFGNLLGIDLEGNPDLAATPAIAFRVAGAFFKSNGCNQLADQQAITRMTIVINGGTVGIQERIQLFGRAKRILQAQAAAPVGGARKGGARKGGARGAGSSDDGGRDVPPGLSRGILPGKEFAGAEGAAEERPAARKAAAKKGAAGKGAAKKSAAKKSGAKKAAAKGGAKKAGAKKAGAKGAAASKGGAKKGAAKKGSARKGGAKKGGAKKGGAKKGGAKKGAGKRR